MRHGREAKLTPFGIVQPQQSMSFSGNTRGVLFMPPMAILVCPLVSIAILQPAITSLGTPQSFGDDSTQIR